MTETTHSDQSNDRYPGEIYSFDEYPEQKTSIDFRSFKPSASEALDLNAMSETERFDRIRSAADSARDKLARDPFSDDAAYDLYIAGRTIADSVLIRGETDPDARQLYGLMGYRYNNTSVKFDHAGEMNKRHAGVHSSSEDQITLNKSLSGGWVKRTAKMLGSKLALKHPQDAQLISIAGTAFHEAGHAMLDDFDDLIHFDDAAKKHHLKASAAYLHDKPEKAYTGDWDADVYSHEERFAEGYSRAGMDEFLTALGYGKVRRAIIMGITKHPDHVEGRRGQNLVDHIPSRPGSKTPVGTRTARPDDYYEGYDGMLGYSNPLTVNELRDQLRDLAKLTYGKGGAVPGVSRKEWATKVSGTEPADTEKAQIRRMQRNRRPEVRAAKFTSQVAGSTLLFASISGQLGEVVEIAEHAPEAISAIGKIATSDGGSKKLFPDNEMGWSISPPIKDSSITPQNSDHYWVFDQDRQEWTDTGRLGGGRVKDPESDFEEYDDDGEENTSSREDVDFNRKHSKPGYTYDSMHKRYVKDGKQGMSKKKSMKSSHDDDDY